MCGEPAEGKIKLQKCTACKQVAYCSRQCQRTHWKVHKPACKAAQANTSTSTTAAEEETKPAGNEHKNGSDKLSVGAKVQLRALEDGPHHDLNGRVGVITEFVESSGRWRVQLQGFRKNFKPTNLVQIE
jgi:hypothetical protein